VRRVAKSIFVSDNFFGTELWDVADLLMLKQLSDGLIGIL
jgi:hypothetical protein